MTVLSMKTSFIKCNGKYLLEECWAKNVVKIISPLSLPSSALPLPGQQYHQILALLRVKGESQHSSKSKHLSSPADTPLALDEMQRKSY